MMPLDPTADIARRAWLPCPVRDHAAGCAACADGENCADHWQYLLATAGTQVFLQCPECAHLWDTDTRFDSRLRKSA
ncbi:hypothetical protein GCM10009765_75630 [Fodinicola feengrottensis]|uniref:Uncharacterized protein n=1 Tax=Fodinicola feengrottensis TaxID=435914 RepID=A0ABN2J0Z6_9ACTN